jgi:hypothetical protein
MIDKPGRQEVQIRVNCSANPCRLYRQMITGLQVDRRGKRRSGRLQVTLGSKIAVKRLVQPQSGANDSTMIACFRSLACIIERATHLWSGRHSAVENHSVKQHRQHNRSKHDQ